MISNSFFKKIGNTISTVYNSIVNLTINGNVSAINYGDAKLGEEDIGLLSRKSRGLYLFNNVDNSTQQSNIIMKTNSDSNPSRTVLQFQRERADGNPITAGQQLGNISFEGWDSDEFRSGLFMYSAATSTWSNTNRGTEMIWFSIADGTTVPSRRLEITMNGAIRFNNAFTFPLTDAAGSGYSLVSDGAGILSWQDTSGTYVPYDGATANVNLGLQELHFGNTDEHLIYDDGGGLTIESNASAVIAIISSMGINLNGRITLSKGTDVASASNIVLGYGGNYFDITGTTDIDTISSSGFGGGSDVYLQFDGSLTVSHDTGGAGSSILLSGDQDLKTIAGTRLWLKYNGDKWEEWGRNSNINSKTTSINAATGTINIEDRHIAVNYTNTNAVTLTLTDGFPIEHTVDISDEECNAGTNNITINRSGSETFTTTTTGNTSLIISGDGDSVTIRKTSSTTWKII